MKTLIPASSLALALAPALALSSAPALAYVGPGAGLGVIGTLFGIVAAIVLAMFGLFWYPLKRAFGKKSATATPAGEAPADPAAHAPGAAPADAGTARVAERQGGDEPPK